jgi:hypothetical protein
LLIGFEGVHLLLQSRTEKYKSTSCFNLFYR